MAIFCPRCGTETTDDRKFCKQCGESLNVPGDNGKTKARPFRLAAAALLLVLAVGAVSFWSGWLSPKSTTTLTLESPVGAFTAAEASELSAVEQARIKAAGATLQSFTIRPDSRIELTIKAPQTFSQSDLRLLVEQTGNFAIYDYESLPTWVQDAVRYQVELQRGSSNVAAMDGQWPTALDEIRGSAKPILTTADIADAVEQDDAMGNPAVDIRLNAGGTRALADYSSSHIDKQIVIVFDDTVVSCPGIESAITDGSFSLSGMLEQGEATMLAAVLKGGALPVQVMTVEAP